MGPNVQFLEGALGFCGRDVEGIVAGESKTLHPHGQTGEEAEISAENLAQSIRLGGGELVGVHLERMYITSQRRQGSKKNDLRVEQQTAEFAEE